VNLWKNSEDSDVPEICKPELTELQYDSILLARFNQEVKMALQNSV
jgi:hypothetical protein